MTVFTTDQWIIIGLVFVLGLLVGAWMTSGGRRKWKTRYNDEVAARKGIETRLREREKEWQAEQERREAALRAAPPVAERREPFVEDRMRDRHPEDVPPRRDLDRDGVPDQVDRRPLDGGRG